MKITIDHDWKLKAGIFRSVQGASKLPKRRLPRPTTRPAAVWVWSECRNLCSNGRAIGRSQCEISTWGWKPAKLDCRRRWLRLLFSFCYNLNLDLWVTVTSGTVPKAMSLASEWPLITVQTSADFTMILSIIRTYPIPISEPLPTETLSQRLCIPSRIEGLESKHI